MSEELRSFLQGTIPLDVLLLTALYLTLTRASGLSDPRVRRRMIGLFAAAIAIQCAHFAEEWATGFNVRFPELVGLYPWSQTLWASFNFVWIAIWCLSLLGLTAGWRAALFPVWFLALACAVNGVAHPLLALAAGGYFPGLWTSPIAGIMGLVLLPRLARFTASDAQPQPAS